VRESITAVAAARTRAAPRRWRCSPRSHLAEQAVPGPVAAIVITGRHLDGHIDEPELQVRAQLCPRAGVAVPQRRVVLPGLEAEFTGPWNRVKDPRPLSGANVEASPIEECVRWSDFGSRGRSLTGGNGSQNGATEATDPRSTGWEFDAAPAGRTAGWREGRNSRNTQARSTCGACVFREFLPSLARKARPRRIAECRESGSVASVSSVAPF
jgi:hypothetical protein